VTYYLLAKIGSGLLVLWCISLIAFGLLAMAPGDPARLILSADGSMTPTIEEVAAKRAELNLDRPLWQRYTSWLSQAIHFDFGVSYRTGKPVFPAYAERFPATLQLAGLTLTITLFAAIPLGVLAAFRRGQLADTLLQGLAALGAAAPGFWVALLLILLFAATLRWLPALGKPTMEGVILPALTLALPNIAILARLIRASTLDTLQQSYLVTARAKGRSFHSGFLIHGSPNVFLTIITALMLEVAYLLTGTAVVETVFAYPGVGRLAVDAALVGDIPVLALCVVVAGLIYVLCNWCADLLMVLGDPRICTR
jgi:ABC-type dipeptide/oligopeptide/nickel transport system permease component